MTLLLLHATVDSVVTENVALAKSSPSKSIFTRHHASASASVVPHSIATLYLTLKVSPGTIAASFMPALETELHSRDYLKYTVVHHNVMHLSILLISTNLMRS